MKGQIEDLSIVISVYNEKGRLEAVLDALPGGAEVIVSDDCSTDGTLNLLKERYPHIKVLMQRKNTRKAGAMYDGFLAATRKYVMFIDADLTYLRPSHIGQLLETVVGERRIVGRAALVGKTQWRDHLVSAAQTRFSLLNGQQVASKEDWIFIFSEIPKIRDKGFGIETAINTTIKKIGMKRVDIEWMNVSQVMKEKKLGARKGFLRRLTMYWDILLHFAQKKKDLHL